jgi:hypothetical protein
MAKTVLSKEVADLIWRDVGDVREAGRDLPTARQTNGGRTVSLRAKRQSSR